MAWVLGLLFTDGTIRAKVDSAPARLSFTQKSPELLTKVQQLMQSTARIYSQPRRVYNGRTAGAVFSFGFCNARICERLFELGLTPRKSLVMRFPDVPRDCLRHFIRGCWDGDGTVHTTPDRQRVVAKSA